MCTCISFLLIAADNDILPVKNFTYNILSYFWIIEDWNKYHPQKFLIFLISHKIFVIYVFQLCFHQYICPVIWKLKLTWENLQDWTRNWWFIWIIENRKGFLSLMSFEIFINVWSVYGSSILLYDLLPSLWINVLLRLLNFVYPPQSFVSHLS